MSMLEVSQMDPHGYTITIKAPDQTVVKNPGVMGRRGQMYITTPSGETVEGGYWMDFPEEGWTFEGVDLYADYEKLRRASFYYSIPQEKRMMMEAVEQATKYQLSSEFEFHRLHPKDSEYKERDRRVQAKMMDQAAVVIGLTARQRFILRTLITCPHQVMDIAGIRAEEFPSEPDGLTEKYFEGLLSPKKPRGNTSHA